MATEKAGLMPLGAEPAVVEVRLLTGNGPVAAPLIVPPPRLLSPPKLPVLTAENLSDQLSSRWTGWLGCRRSLRKSVISRVQAPWMFAEVAEEPATAELSVPTSGR